MKLFSVIAKLALLSLIVLGCPSNAMASPPTARIHVTLTNCDHNKGKPSGIRIAIARTSPFRKVGERDLPMQAPWVKRDWTMDLPEGFYDLLVSAGDCVDDVLLPVLAGQNQDVALIGKSMGLMRDGPQTMVAGTVPLRGYAARIIFDPATVGNAMPNVLLDYPAVVSGNAFYAIGLPEGSATLEVANTNANWATALHFPLGLVTRPGLIVHITPQQLSTETARPTQVVHPNFPTQSPSPQPHNI